MAVMELTPGCQNCDDGQDSQYLIWMGLTCTLQQALGDIPNGSHEPPKLLRGSLAAPSQVCNFARCACCRALFETWRDAKGLLTERCSAIAQAY